VTGAKRADQKSAVARLQQLPRGVTYRWAGEGFVGGAEERGGVVEDDWRTGIVDEGGLRISTVLKAWKKVAVFNFFAGF